MIITYVPWITAFVAGKCSFLKGTDSTSTAALIGLVVMYLYKWSVLTEPSCALWTDGYIWIIDHC
jgi:hypothetical protein